MLPAPRLLWNLFKDIPWKARLVVALVITCHGLSSLLRSRGVVRIKVPHRGTVKVEITQDEAEPTPEELGRRQWVISNWKTLWPEIHRELDSVLKDYEYEATVMELLRKRENCLSISVSRQKYPPSLWSANLTIGCPSGQIEAYVYFGDEGRVDGGMGF